MRWIWRTLFGLVLLLLLAAAGLFVALNMTLPVLDGERELAGLQAEVRITRDRHAVPHIQATSRQDALFALGYVHAQDRLWQMEFQRRVGQGRLSEFAGEATLEADIFLRKMGFHRAAEATLPMLSDQTRADLDAYAAGVNAWIAEPDGLLPPEFLILGIRPEPWTPTDTLTWLKMMALNLSGNWSREVLRARLATRLGPEMMRQIWPDYPANAPVALDRDTARLWRGPGAEAALAARPVPPEGLGSNNWVVDGRLSATGKPLLANDPHLGLQAPSVWYFAHVEDGTDATIGATLPGVPFVVLGRSKHLAWGFTNTGPDVQDLVIEQLNPDNPEEYRTETGWAAFETREEIIRVSGAEPHVLTVRRSRHGPVLFDDREPSLPPREEGKAPRLRPDLPVGHVAVMRWHVLEPGELSVQAGLKTRSARTVADFIAGMRDFHGAQQNMVVADVDGNIGFVAAGRVPVRDSTDAWQGMLPIRGWEQAERLTGFIPFEDLPQTVNPSSGRIVTANNRIVGPAYPHFLTNEWADPFRAQRIVDMLGERPIHTIDSFKAIQADQRSLFAEEFLPLMLRFQPADPRQQRLLAELKDWDRVARADGIEATLFQAWYREFVRQVLIDQTAEDFLHLWGYRAGFMRNVLNAHEGAERWCDDVATDPVEDCAAILQRAFGLAIAELDQRFGSDPEGWRWGDIHAAVSDHAPFTNIPVLKDIFDLRVPVGGDSFTVNVSHGVMKDEDEPFATHHAASLRAIYDLDDLDRSIYIHSTGQSGNPLSPHYDDLSGRWARTGYISMSMQPEDYEPGSIGTLRLIPRP